jgi:opacity protein-like surface antigen
MHAMSNRILINKIFIIVTAIFSVSVMAQGTKFAKPDGFYGGMGIHYSWADDENNINRYHPEYIWVNNKTQAPTARGIGSVNKHTGLDFVEGYRFNSRFGFELSAVLFGESSDVFGFNAMYSPIITENMRLSLKAGTGYSDSAFLPSYGIELEQFMDETSAISLSFMRQPTVTYLDQQPDCSQQINNNGDAIFICQNNLDDNRYKLPVITAGIGYHHYFDRARRLPATTGASEVGTYVGIGSDFSTTMFSTNYDSEPFQQHIWQFDSTDFNILHGFRFNKHYALELSGHYMLDRGDTLRKKHLSMWGFSHKLTSPALGQGLIKGYAKAGSFYSNDQRGGLSYGLGIELYDGPRSYSLGWERLDHRDVTTEPTFPHYYDLLGVKAYYSFESRYPRYRNQAVLPQGSYVTDNEQRSYFMSFTTGSESSQLDESSSLAHQKLALSGYQGLVGFGYQHTKPGAVSLGYEASVGSSSSMYYSTSTLSSYISGETAKRLSYSLSLLPSYDVRGQGSIFGRFGIIRTDWTNETPYGVSSTSTPGASKTADVNEGNDRMSTNGLMLGIGELFPVSAQLGLSFEYVHARYRDHRVTSYTDSNRLTAIEHARYNDIDYIYRPKDDRFMVGARYFLSPHFASRKPQVSNFHQGAYIVASGERDFHTMQRANPDTFDVGNSTPLDEIANDFFPSHFFINGEGIRGTLGYGWMVTPTLHVALEGYGRYTNSTHKVRHYFNLKEDWQYATKHGFGARALLGYALTPSSMGYVHAGIITSEFERSGTDSNDLAYYETDFMLNTEGVTMGLGGELALNDHVGVRLEYSYAAYDAFGIGDPKEKSSGKWNYYRLFQDNYSIGLRYRL